jgi:regulatory protein
MELTALVQSRKMNYVQVYLDNEYALSIPLKLIADFKLYKGRQISEEEWEQIRQLTITQNIYDNALRLIALRPHGIKELQRKLSEKYRRKNQAEPPAEILELTISRLKAEGFLDDNAFCRVFISDRIHNTRKSRFQIRNECRKKGMDEEIINLEMAKINWETKEEEDIIYLVQKKLRELKDKDLPPGKRKEKTIASVLRKGYKLSAVLKAYNEQKDI